MGIMTQNLENLTGRSIPDALLRALSCVRGKYSLIEEVFFLIQIEHNHFIGVAGDGDNGGYEHFDFCDGKLTISDVGYGQTLVALQDILNKTLI